MKENERKNEEKNRNKRKRRLGHVFDTFERFSPLSCQCTMYIHPSYIAIIRLLIRCNILLLQQQQQN